MAQRALPQLNGRIRALACTQCGVAHLDTGPLAVEPRGNHVCDRCGRVLRDPGKLRNVVSNPLVAVLAALASKPTDPGQRNRAA